MDHRNKEGGLSLMASIFSLSSSGAVLKNFSFVGEEAGCTSHTWADIQNCPEEEKIITDIRLQKTPGASWWQVLCPGMGKWEGRKIFRTGFLHGDLFLLPNSKWSRAQTKLFKSTKNLFLPSEAPLTALPSLRFCFPRDLWGNLNRPLPGIVNSQGQI